MGEVTASQKYGENFITKIYNEHSGIWSDEVPPAYERDHTIIKPTGNSTALKMSANAVTDNILSTEILAEINREVVRTVNLAAAQDNFFKEIVKAFKVKVNQEYPMTDYTAADINDKGIMFFTKQVSAHDKELMKENERLRAELSKKDILLREKDQQIEDWRTLHQGLSKQYSQVVAALTEAVAELKKWIEYSESLAPKPEADPIHRAITATFSVHAPVHSIMENEHGA
jgi:hypothetical protein